MWKREVYTPAKYYTTICIPFKSSMQNEAFSALRQVHSVALGWMWDKWLRLYRNSSSTHNHKRFTLAYFDSNAITSDSSVFPLQIPWPVTDKPLGILSILSQWIYSNNYIDNIPLITDTFFHPYCLFFVIRDIIVLYFWHGPHADPTPLG